MLLYPSPFFHRRITKIYNTIFQTFLITFLCLLTYQNDIIFLHRSKGMADFFFSQFQSLHNPAFPIIPAPDCSWTFFYNLWLVMSC